jgi:RNA polymerase sigma-70 factor, ECF subfamily
LFHNGGVLIALTTMLATSPDTIATTSGIHAAVPALSFREIYEQHAAFVWRVLRRFGVRPTDVEDVCQEVFLIVHRKLPAFEHRSSVKTWLYGIALRCASGYRRRAYVVREITSDAEESAVEGAQHDSVAHRQARALLDRILDGLDEDKRVVFVLYELEELAMAEIAEIVECPLQTAYSRLHAARAAVESAASRLHAREQRS